MATIIAQRNPTTFLVTEDPPGNVKNARVLDLSQGRLFPPYPVEQLLKAGPWRTDVEFSEEETQKLLTGIEHIDLKLRDDVWGGGTP